MINYSDQVKADAKAAADYIREHGWCQQTTREGKNGPCCALGAIWSICGCEGLYNQCELERAFKSEIHGNIPVWNDTPGRTKEEVLAVFDRIAGSNQPPEGRDKMKP